MKDCDICLKKNVRIDLILEDKNYCYNCYRKFHQELCNKCGKLSRIDLRINGLPYCSNCSRYFKEKQKCSFCNEISIIHDRKNNLCSKCYKKNKKKENCSLCGKLSIVEKRENNKPICGSCASRQRAKECSKCNEIKPIHYKKLNLCHRCYRKESHKECSKCKNIRRIETKDGLCLVCYKKEKMKSDEQFRIKELIRKRIRNSIFRKKSIKYEKIIDFLGPCPGELFDYHIDHIFPLSAFGLDEFDIAFCPENHQWLLVKDNLIKGVNYDKEELEKFKEKIKIKYNL